jgi:hypothetical protein
MDGPFYSALFIFTIPHIPSTPAVLFPSVILFNSSSMIHHKIYFFPTSFLPQMSKTVVVALRLAIL